MVMDRIIPMGVILLVVVTGEVLNPHLTTKVTTPTDTNHIVLGVQEEMVPSMATEVPEVVKE